jgi:hypothetical protein
MKTKKETTAPEAGAVVNSDEIVVENVYVVGENGLVKVRFLLSPTRKFSLGYSAGEEGEFEEKQANELVEAKYAEFVK